MKRPQSRLSIHLFICISVMISVLLLAVVGLTVSAETSGDYTYDLADGQATITRYAGAGGDVVIPSALDGYPVVAIGNNAFENCNVAKSFTIPASISNIGSAAFYRCSILTDFYVDSANSSLMSVEGVLLDITGATLIQYPIGRTDTTYAIPTGVTTIGDRAFSYGKNLTSMVIPDGVTTIGTYAFSRCSMMTSLSIPGSVTTMGSSAFIDCSALTSVTLLDGINSIGQTAFYNCSSLTSITLPASLTSIGNSAFYRCDALTGISLPVSLTSIGSSAFSMCRALASLNIPDSVNSIGSSAFSYCLSLTSVDLPEGLTRIEDSTFYMCVALSSVSISRNITSIGDGVFFYCKALAEINVDTANLNYMSIDGVLFDKAAATLLIYPCGKLGLSYEIPGSVTTIGTEAFAYSTLTSVTIPDGVTCIESQAFGWCSSLASVTIPGSVTFIGDYAFQACIALPGIVLPDRLTVINSGVFFGCSSLASVTIPESVTVIGGSSFMSCFSLRSIDIPDSVISIGGYAFSQSGLVSITLPESISVLNYHTFRVCESLQRVTLPASLTTISSGVFAYCSSLTDITFLGITPPTAESSWISNTRSTLRGHAYYGSGFPAPGGAFNGLIMGSYIPEEYYYTVSSGQATITGYHGAGGEVTIPATLGGCPVVAIGDNAFAGCDALTRLTIPGHVTSIGSRAFDYCYYLFHITFLGLTPPATDPDWMTDANIDLRGHAYYGSSFPAPTCDFNGLTMGEYIPEGYYYFITDGQATITRYLGGSQDIVTPTTLGGCPVVAIGKRAFCSPYLTSVVIRDGVTSIGDSAFAYCFSLSSLTIPGSVASIGESTFSSCSALTQITLMDGVQSIGIGAFAWCTSLPSLSLPDSLTSIGDTAFYGCSSLTSITLPRGVASMGQFAFMRCSAMTEISVDAANPHYASLGGILFDKTGTVLVQYPIGRPDASFVIPTGVTAIGNGAFATCCALTSITIPDSVTSIGDSAFYECTGLTDLALPGSVTDIGDYAFEECTSLTSLTIPSGVTRIGDYSFADCTSLFSVDLPAGLTSIGEHSFAWCEALTGITIPDGVTCIEDYAFRGCISLTSITLPDGVTSIGNRAFEWCSSLRDITFLSLAPPAIADSSNWLDSTSADLRGHAYFGAGFPAPGQTFNGLVMGDYIAPPITETSPSSPLVLYTQGDAVTRVFAASYLNHSLVTAAALTVDADEPLTLDTASFSCPVALAVGPHSITLTIEGAAGNKATYTWLVTVILDTKAPTLSGISNNQKIVYGSPVTISIADELSGVDWNSLQVIIDDKDVTAGITMTANSFTLTSSVLSRGDHTIRISVSDNVGNTVVAKYEVKVK